MEVKDKKPNIIAIIGAVILLVLAVIGLSYAFFNAFIKGSETDTTIEGTGAKLSLIYTDGKSVITSSNIMPGWSATKTFTVTNNGEGTAYYKLNISNITNEFVPGGLTFSITSNDGGATIAEMPVGTENRTISDTITIEASKTHTYTITAKYINLDVDQIPDLGKPFSYTIGIEAGQKVSTLADTILASNEVKTPLTTPGVAVSTSSEALLASVEDDYGISYYFRGAVTNNYVQFANKCWRIVRITGNKSIKLVLHNDNTSKVTNPCSSTNNSTSAAFAKYSGTTYTSSFNTSFADNAYIGFMYGTTSSSSYNVTHANTNKSTILTNLETWYENNLSLYEKYLADTIWCNDKSIFSGTGYGTSTTYYSTHNRLNTENTPTLKCPTDNNNLSRFTVSDTITGNGKLKYKIGLLTADEVTFAGYKNSSNNSTVYLQENATDNKWWTISPDYIMGSSTRIWSVSGNIGYLNYSISNSASGIRPSISLISSVEVGGTGTAEDPYVVK